MNFESLAWMDTQTTDNVGEYIFRFIHEKIFIDLQILLFSKLARMNLNVKIFYIGFEYIEIFSIYLEVQTVNYSFLNEYNR